MPLWCDLQSADAVLVVAPRDPLSHDAAGRTIDAPHRVRKHYRNLPQGNELAAPLALTVNAPVVARAGYSQPEQIGRPLARGSIGTSSVGRSASSAQRGVP